MREVWINNRIIISVMFGKVSNFPCVLKYHVQIWRSLNMKYIYKISACLNLSEIVYRLYMYMYITRINIIIQQMCMLHVFIYPDCIVGNLFTPTEYVAITTALPIKSSIFCTPAWLLTVKEGFVCIFTHQFVQLLLLGQLNLEQPALKRKKHKSYTN